MLLRQGPYREKRGMRPPRYGAISNESFGLPNQV